MRICISVTSDTSKNQLFESTHQDTTAHKCSTYTFKFSNAAVSRIPEPSTDHPITISTCLRALERNKTCRKKTLTMVRNYIRKTQKKWTADSVKLAFEAVLQEKISIKKASLKYHIPPATLALKLRQIRSKPEVDLDSFLHRNRSDFQTVFRKQQEEELCHFIHTLQSQFIPLSTLDVRQLAYEMAEMYSIPHRFNKNSAIAGKDWCRGFLKRNPDICINKPDCNKKFEVIKKDEVDKFFDLLEGIVSKHKLEANDIYNLDETIITCSLQTSSNALVTQEEQNSNGNDNKYVKVVACFSASGAYVPLMLIFPCSSKNQIFDGALPATWAQFDPNGEMQLDIFVKWLKKFIKFSKATKDSPVLLIVNGYHTYLKKLQVLELVKKNGVNILCLPLHCSEKLQPMQQNFMQLLRTAYTIEVAKWLHCNSRSLVSVQEAHQLFENAFLSVATLKCPIDGFRSTGIWPIDRDHFDNKFMEVTKEEFTGLKTNLKVTDKEESSISIKDGNISERPDLPTVLSKNIVQEPIVVFTESGNQPRVVKIIGIMPIINQPSFNEPQMAEHYSNIEIAPIDDLKN